MNTRCVSTTVLLECFAAAAAAAADTCWLLSNSIRHLRYVLTKQGQPAAALQYLAEHTHIIVYIGLGLFTTRLYRSFLPN